MAKIKPIEVIAGMSGKVCTHGDMYFATNSQTGKIYTGKMCYPSHQPPTAKQIAQRELFKTRSQTVSQWFTDNKPTQQRPQGTAEYQRVLAAYKSQHKVGSIFAYVSKALYVDGQVVVPEGSTTGGEQTASRHTLTVSASPSNGGTVTGGGEYAHNAAVTVTASPASGYKFTQWSDGNTQATRTVVLSDDLSLTATFTTTGGSGGGFGA